MDYTAQPEQQLGRQFTCQVRERGCLLLATVCQAHSDGICQLFLYTQYILKFSTLQACSNLSCAQKGYKTGTN